MQNTPISCIRNLRGRHRDGDCDEEQTDLVHSLAMLRQSPQRTECLLREGYNERGPEDYEGCASRLRGGVAMLA